MKNGPAELIDARLAKALAHPLRVRELAALNEAVASPNQLAEQVGEPLQNVSYHVRVLHGLGCIELVSTAQRRGAIEHFYRAVTRPFFSDRDWERLPRSARHTVSDVVLQLVWEDAAEALRSGRFDERHERHLSRTPLALDDKGWADLNQVLAETLAKAMDIQTESAGRRSEMNGDATETRLVMMHFPAGPSADKPKRRKRG